ncbi:MAG: response regulator [Oligoflexales bacterium]|nr:response regulator [Oligoflexales bacterium]
MVTKAEEKKLRILIVDDDPQMADVVKISAKKAGYETQILTDSVAAKEALEKESYDVLLTDLRMPKVSGLELVKTAVTVDPTMKIIIITGNGLKEDAVQAIRYGVFDFLDKPFSIPKLEIVLKNAMDLKRAEDAREELLAIIKGMTSP